MPNTVKRYIITGAPGTGKSSILFELMKKRYTCFPEVSRKIIKEQQEMDGNLFPWENLYGFALKCYEKMLADCKLSKFGINFFDRGIPDNITYLYRRELPVADFYYEQLSAYQKEVFFFPVWPEIFVNDPQRPESIDEAYLLEKNLLETYQKLGFKLHRMVLVDINQRVNNIEKIIKNEKE